MSMDSQVVFDSKVYSLNIDDCNIENININGNLKIDKINESKDVNIVISNNLKDINKKLSINTNSNSSKVHTSYKNVFSHNFENVDSIDLAARNSQPLCEPELPKDAVKKIIEIQ